MASGVHLFRPSDLGMSSPSMVGHSLAQPAWLRVERGIVERNVDDVKSNESRKSFGYRGMSCLSG